MNATICQAILVALSMAAFACEGATYGVVPLALPNDSYFGVAGFGEDGAMVGTVYQHRSLPSPAFEIVCEPDGCVLVESVLPSSSETVRLAVPGLWDRQGRFTEVPLAQLPGASSWRSLEGWASSSAGGLIVGRYNSVGGTPPLPRPGLSPGRAFVWSQATRTAQDISLYPSLRSMAIDVNSSGLVAGSALALVAIDGQTYGAPRAYAWTEERGAFELGDLGGRQSQSTALNESGFIVGYAEDENEFERAFLWNETDGMTELVPRSWGASRALDINNRGEVLINLDSSPWSPPSKTHNPLLFRGPDDYIEIVPPNGQRGSASQVNDLGQVVASYSRDISGQAPFLWTAEADAVDLQSLLPEDTPWSLEAVVDIDNRGRILTVAYSGIAYQPLLLVPVPEPPSGTTLVAFCLALAAHRARSDSAKPRGSCRATSA